MKYVSLRAPLAGGILAAALVATGAGAHEPASEAEIPFAAANLQETVTCAPRGPRRYQRTARRNHCVVSLRLVETERETFAQNNEKPIYIRRKK